MSDDHTHGPGEDHGHEHLEGVDHGHSHETTPNYDPQPVPMSTRTAIIEMVDGTDRIVTTFSSVNGQWVTFFDRDGAVEYAKTLLALAYTPPKDSTEKAPESVEVEVEVPDNAATIEGEIVTAPN